jgi:predicted ATPase
MIREICPRNLLSFGPETPPLKLSGLNVFIGINGSGKSNLIEVISLLQAAPKALALPIRDGGGVREWLWKGAPRPVATLETVVDYPEGSMPLRHVLSFTEVGQRFEVVDERIEDECPQGGLVPTPFFYYQCQPKHPIAYGKGEQGQFSRESIDVEQSILSQRKDPVHYPEITYLGRQYEQVRIYREWSFGRNSLPRRAQRADERNDFLTEDVGNLGLVLNRFRRDALVKKSLLKWLYELYEGIDDFDMIVEGGTVQVFFHEGRFEIPATRLSDGTLRYLCLLAILCHPSPPPVVCIEEPELGLHPDVLPALGKLLKEASERTQLLVTTHSEVLVDELTDMPESVVVCDKVDGATRMTRLSKESLRVWLGEYSLGRLWSRGELGGNRW